MGGNALSQPSVRLATKDYDELAEYVYQLFCNHRDEFDNLPLDINYYHTKETHGDMDLLYTGPVDRVIEIMKEEFGDGTEIVRNGPVTSIGIQIPQGLFQLDFIHSPKELYDFAYRYYSWNDCGNLIGRVAHRIGLKFGHDGLWYIQRSDDGHIIYEHLLTREFNQALMYLDLDFVVHAFGFDTPEDIYAFIVKSRYFDYGSVELSQRNAVSRIRDKKRVMYTNFLKWLKERGLDHQNQNLGSKESYLEMHREYWPEFATMYDKAAAAYKEKQVIKSKFNGTRIMELTGMKGGKELGAFMTTLRSQEWYKDIVDMPQSIVDSIIVSEYSKMGNE